jgi:flagellar FliL protein
MSDKTEKPAAEGADAAAKPAKATKGKGKLFAILGVVVLVLAGGGGTAFWMTRTPAEAAEAEHAEVDLAHAGIIKFEPFIVNLADPGAKRFLRVSIGIIVPSEEVAKEIEHGEVLRMQLRSEIIDLLTTQTSEHVVTPEGKTALKKEILERAHHTLAPHAAHDVIFSDFVVQY